MNVRKKLLKMLIAMYGCTALFSFGELSKEMVDGMRKALKDVGIDSAEKIRIEPMSQAGIIKGWYGVCLRNEKGFPESIMLDETMYSNDKNKSRLREVLYYHEAIHAKRHYANGDDRKHLKCYYQNKSLPFVQCLFYFLCVQISLLARADRTLVSKEGKNLVKVGLALTSVVMGIEFVYNFFKSICIYNIQKKSNNILQQKINDNAIEDFKRYYSAECSEHLCGGSCTSCLGISCAIGKCIRMKQEFEARVGSLAMISVRDKNFSYMNFLKDKMKKEHVWKRDPNDEYPSLYEQAIYTKDLMRACKPGVNCLEGLENCTNKYLRERVQGTLKREAQQYSSIEKHVQERREEKYLDSLLS